MGRAIAKEAGDNRTVQKVSLGFRFTKEEERAMEYAKRLAESFMISFGRGKRVKPIDRSHYL